MRPVAHFRGNHPQVVQLFVSVKRSAFDAAIDLAYKGYRIAHRDSYPMRNADKNVRFPSCGTVAIYSVAKLPRVLR